MADDIAPDTIARFWVKVEKTDGCWLWRARIDRLGYGQFGWRSGPNPRPFVLVHRFAYELVIGPIPDGLELDHLCRVRHCCNPDHLEPVTHAENMRRSAGALKTHCKNGHEFTPENTAPQKGSSGRSCRICRRAANQRYKARLRAS